MSALSAAPRPLRFAGYAAVFGIPDAARDIILPGAFRETLTMRGEPLPLLWQHHPGQRIGTIERVAEDAHGLRVVARIERADSRAARLMEARAISGLSFGYRTRAHRNTAAGRILAAIDLVEISLVTHPLQHGARVHLIAA